MLTSNATLQVGTGCTDGALADLNADGKPDLLILQGKTVIIFTNAGNARFVSNSIVTLPSTGGALLVGDFNNDGRLDFAGGGAVCLNNGGGAFTINATGAAVLAVGDLNGDGWLDLVIAGNGVSFGTMTNDGAGNFTAGTGFTLANASNYGLYGLKGAAVADMNGDFLADVVFYDGSQPQGHFAVATNGPSGWLLGGMFSGSVEAYCMGLADLNNDNRPDMVFGNSSFGNSSITVAINTSIYFSPPVNIVNLGGTNLVYWRGPSPNSVLQMATNLTNPVWRDMTNGLPVKGMLTPGALPASYYRLISR